MKVSKLTIGRLFNLGNFEHIRYEIAVELEPTDNAGESLTKLEGIINGLGGKSPVDEHELRRANIALSKPAGEMDAMELSNLQFYKNTVAKFDEWQKARVLSREAFGELGGASKYEDAKDRWDPENS